ncbi:MAG: response regulator [Myxococcales bacterium]|nr:response regulator [Myxococcales bacterium]
MDHPGQSSLARASAVVLAERDLDAALPALCQELVGALSVTAGGVFVFEEGGLRSLALVGWNSTPARLDRPGLQLLVEQAGGVVFLPTSGATGIVAAALDDGEALRGVVAVAVARALGEEERALLVALARQITLALVLGQLRASATDKQARLAAGIAQEINNPLSYVLTNIDWVERDLEELIEQLGARGDPDTADRLAECFSVLAEAHQGADRVRGIVRDLRVLSGVGDAVPEVVDVRQVIASAIAVAEHEIHRRAELILDLGEVPPVRLDVGQLGQVLVNLLVNAAQAEGGERHTVRVRTSVDAKGRVAIDVEDTGRGIPPEILARIFDPFFTTKPVGEGTGLGLAIGQSLVRGFGGEILVDSVVGHGSTFSVRIPPVSAEVRESTPAPLRRTRVLVVDDQPQIGVAVRRALGRDHEVVHVETALAGLAELEEGAFDVVLCDLVLPGMGGLEFHETLTRRLPALAGRTLFITGVELAPDVATRVAGRVLRKPFKVRDLRAMVSRLTP